MEAKQLHLQELSRTQRMPLQTLGRMHVASKAADHGRKALLSCDIPAGTLGILLEVAFSLSISDQSHPILNQSPTSVNSNSIVLHKNIQLTQSFCNCSNWGCNCSNIAGVDCYINLLIGLSASSNPLQAETFLSMTCVFLVSPFTGCFKL